MNNYINVPIEAAKYISAKFNKSQVIIVCWDKDHRRIHVTTYGDSDKDSEGAAKGGNLIRKTFGWPDELCHEKSNRSICADNRELRKGKSKL